MWTILDVPVGLGASRDGTEYGPRALRDAGLFEAVRRQGYHVVDGGRVAPGLVTSRAHPNPVLKALAPIAAWTRAIADATFAASGSGRTMILGGDHSISAGSIAGIARRASAKGRPLFVLWIDAHPDFHTLDSSTSGNLHGIPLAYLTGQPGFEPYLPPLATAVDPGRVCILGARDIDPAERSALAATNVTVHEMERVRQQGLAALVGAFLDRVAAADGMLHVSFDVDVLDPSVAPAVGTAVPAGATIDDACLLMDLLHDSDLVTSLDVVELNPSLDETGRTARLVVDLIGRLMGSGATERATSINERRRA